LILAGHPEPQFSPSAHNDGLFGPSSVTWIVHADSAMIVGGLTALLLQTVQPAAMAAVAEYSDYQSDPLGRLRRTVAFLGTTTFGSSAEAEAALARLVEIHSHIHGSTDEGVPYRADDPHLLAWVHATEVWAFLTAHRRYGKAELTYAQYDRYVSEMATIGGALGVIDAPHDQVALAACLDSYRPELKRTELSAGAVRFLAEFRLKRPAGAAYRTLFNAALLLQPPWAARMHPLQPHAAQRLVVPSAANGLIRTIGWALDYSSTDADGSAN
jgi:uncharacterized protein (DUF2236 family)